MFSTLRTRFGIPGVISVIALVFAMFGGAYAASNSSGGGKATASAKAKRGPRGPKGATGDAGPVGPKGDVGPPGTNGTNGTNGSPGSPGAPGKSVTSSSFEGTNEPASEPCEEYGGVSFNVEGSAETRYACNGANGEPGSPWTVGGTLPAGATETGSYSYFSSDPSEQSVAFTSIAFGVPLAAALDSTHTIFVGIFSNPDPTNCTGTIEDPKAASGYLCVYGGQEFESEFIAINRPAQVPTLVSAVGTPGAGKTGAVIRFTAFGKEAQEEGIPVRGFGTYAVTG